MVSRVTFVVSRFWDPSKKMCVETTMQFRGTNAPRSLTATRLVTKNEMKLHPHNPQFWSHVNPPIPQSLTHEHKTESLFPHKVRGNVSFGAGLNMSSVLVFSP